MSNEDKQLKTTIARRIREVRLQKGMTQQDLADAAGLKVQGTVSQYEAGQITFNISSLIRIANGLGCTIDHLLGRDAAYNEGGLRGRLFTAFSSMDTTEQEQFVRMLEFLAKEKT